MSTLVSDSATTLLDAPATEDAPSGGQIMIVDDEPINIKRVQKYLQAAGYERFITTSDAREALPLVQQCRPDVVLLDIMMPHVNGLEILRLVRSDAELRHLPVLILTAATDEETKVQALDLGATDFLQKPVKPTELAPRVRNALVVKAHHDHLAEYSARLEAEVRERTAELIQSRQEVIHILARAAEYRDSDTGSHVARVGRCSGILAKELGYDDYYAELIEQAAILHDVGKIGIPDSILFKPGKLTAHEMQIMKKHCEYGVEILSGSHRVTAPSPCLPRFTTNSPVLQMAIRIAASHHERWDGSGYPLGAAGEQIPIEGRIVAVADVLDALCSRRPYKDAYPFEKAAQILEEGRGTHFDPRVLDAFNRRKEEIARLLWQLSDGVA